MSEIRFVVHGNPAPKGSATAFYSEKQGRTFSHQSKSVQEWERLVRSQAQTHAAACGLWEGPVSMALEFYLLMPKSLPKKRQATAMPDKHPDLDKLARAVLDALKGVIYRDDAQVVSITPLTKRYGNPPRVEIVLRGEREEMEA